MLNIGSEHFIMGLHVEKNVDLQNYIHTKLKCALNRHLICNNEVLFGYQIWCFYCFGANVAH